MTLPLLLTLLVRGVALVLAVVLLRRLRDWRAAVAVALLTVMLVPPALELWGGRGAGVLVVFPPTDLVQLAVSVLALAAVVVVGGAAHAHGGAQTALRIETAYWERLFESSPEAVVLLTTDDRVVRANTEFYRMFGYVPEEAVGRRINDLIVPDDLKDEGLGLTKRVAQGDPVSVETVRRRQDGSLVPVSILGTPIEVDGGRVAVYGIYRELTARTRAERELRESEERYHTLLDELEDGYYEVDVRGNLIAFNQSICRILGYSAHELLGMNNRSYMDPDAARSLYAVFNEVYRTGRPAAMLEFVVVRKDGRRRRVEGSVTPVRDAAGTIAGFRGIVRDVTERKDAQDAVQRLGAAMEAARDGMAIFDRAGRLIYANAAYARMFGYRDAAELMGESWRTLHGAEERRRFRETILPAVRAAGTWQGEAVGRRRDGGAYPQELSLSLLADGGVTCVVRDITDRTRADAALRESEKRYALAARGANDGLWDWNLRTDKLYLSPRWKEQLGYGEGAVGSSPEEWFGRVHPEDLERLRGDIAAHLDGAVGHLESEHRMRHADGNWRWMLCRGVAERNADGAPLRMAGSQTDVTERRRVAEQLEHDAFHDALTRLPNRALFMDRLRHALGRVRRRGGYLFAVVFLDLDRFKVVNDSLGHALGDQLLVAVSQRLLTLIRPGDTVARLGGDEFVILLEDLERAEDATRVAERIQHELARPVNLRGHDVVTTASIGIALSARGYEQPEDLLRDADLALYRAKALGKARHEVFDSALHQRAMERLELESDLRRAVERREFVLHYQPIVALSGGGAIAFEALLRWQHRERGLVEPDRFIPVAEETGLILPIGLWVLREACGRMREWRSRFPAAADLAVHVNLSGRQFAQRDLVAQVRRVLKEVGLPPRALGLEITESVVMDDAEAAAAMLGELRALDVQLQIDDFGTGYSSLSYLHRFPIDTLKIDRSFVMKVGVNGENSEIVRSIISLARDLGLEAVAEGVETAAQATLLRSLGCAWGQGNHLSPVLDAAAVERLLASQWRAAV